MTVEQYIEQRIRSSLCKGIPKLDKEFHKRYKDFSRITSKDLESWSQDVHRLMQEAKSYTPEHVYWWSLHTHLLDIIQDVKVMESCYD